ncbi:MULTISPECIES: branched-chain amino acid aminotransferase [Peribacillus]|uniref:branched-chain amino acid aminotransferase n=1 Tax=Peribacillus TaxID=2675229 RepID=UPI001F4DF2FF|nr:MULTISPECIES: branched-chain amino acid aminotransferase [unclassified Peribacillus]MCK1983046.1 branched-chain amino acid aminotransferase [Peribacillus sp. Aquil_B1]MCK2009148.1 branched-chain amino acid aminotransferase [Peribacillus sp. Aquil_B8]
MLKKQMESYISKSVIENKVELFKEEKDYVEKHKLIADDIILVEKENASRFTDAYMERSNKESEELISEESSAFLSQPIEYLKNNKDEFLYFESQWFDLIGVEALSLEVDDVFGTYNAMFGLKFQKKMGEVLKTYLTKELQAEIGSFSLMFNQGDGLWDVNVALDNVKGFREDMTLEEAFNLIYHFLFILVQTIEEDM